MKLRYSVVLSRQAENFYKKLDAKAKAQVRDCPISLEDEAYSGKRLHGDLKESLACALKENTGCLSGFGEGKNRLRDGDWSSKKCLSVINGRF